MLISRIHRYIIREISIPTFLSLLIFTFVLLMGKIPKVTELVVSKGVPALDILYLFSCLIPTFLSVTLPLAFLLGILLAFGRLSADSEFIALKSSGVSLYYLIKPVFFLALLIALVTGWTTLFLEPASKSVFRGQLFRIATSHVSANIKPAVFIDSFDGIVLYARGMDEDRGILNDLFISDERDGTTPVTMTAQEGRFISDPGNYRLTLRLKNGSIHRHPKNSREQIYQTAAFLNYDLTIDTPNPLEGAARRKPKRSELSWFELNQAIRENSDKAEYYRLLAEKHGRIVIAFAPLVLVPVGVPLGLQSQRSGKGAGFTLALVVFLIYYILLSVSGTIAEKGLVPGALILWLPNVCFLCGGAYFLHCTAEEKKLRIITLPQQLWNRWQDYFSRARG